MRVQRHHRQPQREVAGTPAGLPLWIDRRDNQQRGNAIIVQRSFPGHFGALSLARRRPPRRRPGIVAHTVPGTLFTHARRERRVQDPVSPRRRSVRVQPLRPARRDEGSRLRQDEVHFPLFEEHQFREALHRNG